MKLFYNIDVDARSFEGRTRTALFLKERLEEKGIEFTEDPAEADILHFHSSGIADSFKAVSYKKKYNKPVIYSLYSLCETEPFAHLTNHLQQRYYLGKRKTSFLLSYSAALPLRWRAFQAQNLDKVIVPTNYTAQKLFSNTELIRIGVDTEKYKPCTVVKNKQRLQVGFFGHPSVYKGLIDFVKASNYFAEDIDVHVFLSRKNDYMEKRIHALNPKIKLQGYVENIVQSYNQMDIIVAPHRSKLGSIANPLVILESMACGKAVITTKFNFIEEIVGDTAVLVPPASPQAIAAAVEQLKDHKLREELGQKARKRILKEFNAHTMVEKHVELYQKIMNSQPTQEK